MLNAFLRSSIRKTKPALFALACLALLLPACAPTQSGSSSPSGGKTQQLAYGVSIFVPDGWIVESAILPEAATNAELDARVANGERIILFSMHRPSSDPVGRNAIAGLFLVDSERNFPPEERSAHLTQEDLERYGQAILARDREIAERNQSQSNLRSWQVSKTLMGNKLTLVHRGTAQGRGGVLNLYDVNMYLPNKKGLALKTMSDPSIPGTEQIIEAIISSLHVQ